MSTLEGFHVGSRRLLCGFSGCCFPDTIPQDKNNFVSAALDQRIRSTGGTFYHPFSHASHCEDTQRIAKLFFSLCRPSVSVIIRRTTQHHHPPLTQSYSAVNSIQLLKTRRRQNFSIPQKCYVGGTAPRHKRSKSQLPPAEARSEHTKRCPKAGKNKKTTNPEGFRPAFSPNCVIRHTNVSSKRHF